MSGARVLKKMLLAQQRSFEKSFDRITPRKFTDIELQNPLSVLEELVIGWPPCDVRYEPSYARTHEIEPNDSELMKDVYRGLSLKVLHKMPTDGKLIVGVFLQSNLAEFERYNEAVQKHNEEWEKNGSPEDVFDPRTGDIHTVKDKSVRKALAKSSFLEHLDLEDESDGNLSKARPKEKRHLYLTVSYKLETIEIAGEDPYFRLGYIVTDYKDRIVYYNELESLDLSYLVRRATQEIYGHPFILTNKGPFFDGISLLIQGKKIPLCQKYNKVPLLAAESKVKKTREVHAVKNVEIGTGEGIGILFGILIPIAAIVYAVGISLVAVNSYNDYRPWTVGMWMAHVFVALFIFFIAGKVGVFFKEKVEIAKLQKKFL
jgi:hypothetical protein